MLPTTSTAITPFIPSVVIEGHTFTMDPHTLLGEGSFAQVYQGNLVIKKDSSPPPNLPNAFAFKCIVIPHREGDAKKLATKCVSNEQAALHHLAKYAMDKKQEGLYPWSLIQGWGMQHYPDQGMAVIVLDLLPTLTLDRYLKTKQRLGLPAQQALLFAHQVTKAVAYMHEARVAHRDIKVENIALDLTYNEVILYDLGFAMLVPPSKDSKVLVDNQATPLYMSPEQEAANRGNAAWVMDPFLCDIWQLGHVFFSMMVGHDFFQRHVCRTMSDMTLQLQIARPDPCYCLDGELAATPATIRNIYHTLLRSTLAYAPPSRRFKAALLLKVIEQGQEQLAMPWPASSTPILLRNNSDTDASVMMVLEEQEICVL